MSMISGSSRIGYRKAVKEDIDGIKRIADQHKQELGFVIKSALERSIETSELIVSVDESGAIRGFVHYRHRKDNHTTLYNIAVEPAFRGQSIGRGLVDQLRQEAESRNQTSIMLKCPSELPANQFYQRYGFTLLTTENGKHRKLHIWQLQV